MAVGFSDSIIKVWSLVPQKLRGMKSAELLSDIEKDAGEHCTTPGAVFPNRIENESGSGLAFKDPNPNSDTTFPNPNLH